MSKLSSLGSMYEMRWSWASLRSKCQRTTFSVTPTTASIVLKALMRILWPQRTTCRDGTRSIMGFREISSPEFTSGRVNIG